jgi:TolA-binding protein
MTDDAPLDPTLRAVLLADEGGPTLQQRERLAQRLAVTTGVALVARPRLLPKLLAAGAIFAAGVGVGIGVDRLRSRPVVVVAPRDAAPADVPIDVPRDASTDAAPLDAMPAPPAPIDATRPHARDATAAPADAGVSSDQLARERRLLEVARSALHSGDAQLAAKNLIEHELRYPDGALREERLVLQIELAVQRGDTTDAAHRAEAFRREYPSSAFAARVDQLVPR